MSAIAASVVTLPGYYALYALYADLLVNRNYHARLEDLERVREALKVIAPALALEQPFRKSWALRLFTERQALSAHAPELVDEAWRQLRQEIEALGPPPGWRGPTPRERIQQREFKPQPPPAPPPEPPRFPEFPRSPVDYRREV